MGALLGDVVQGLGGAGHLCGVVGELGQGGALALLHARQIGEQLADLVATGDVYGYAQIIFGKALKVLAGIEQWAQHTAGDKPPAQHRQQQTHHHQRHAQHLCSTQAVVGLKHDLLAAFAQCGHQLLAQ
ncbi:hypothetical protein D3C72_1544360 [compost metagenome]